MKRIGTLLIAVAILVGTVACGEAVDNGNGDGNGSRNGNGEVSYQLSVSSTSGGSAIEPGEGVHIYEEGTVVGLLAEPFVGYRFVSWTGDVGTIARVDAASTTITIDDDYAVTARFQCEGVCFACPNLDAVIRKAIGNAEEPIYPEDLRELTELKATVSDIASLTGLEYCTSLSWLDVRWNKLRDISPVANLTSLTHLWLCGNEIRTISPVADLTSLTHLWLSGNEISNISPVAGLTNLTALNLLNNQISDISPVAGLTNLTSLNLWGNQVGNISPLMNLTNLRHLELPRNQIGNISPLQYLTNLGYVNLGYNQISDISPLANLTNLTHLDLASNRICDILPLVDNLGLGEGDRVILAGNPLSEESINDYIPVLRARGVRVIY